VTEREMTRGEREELKKLARERARVAKADAARRTADLKAMFEQQVITLYDYNRDEVWKAAVEEARAAAEAAQEQIAKRCQELGIPAEFAPSVTFEWRGRGRYLVEMEQQDLRRAAYKRIDAMERTAKHEIDRKALEIQTELVAAGMTSGRAVEFLSSMPSVDDLMPEVDISTLDGGPQRRSLGMGDDFL
jgi:predicted HicB family RNase H-like nuclease